MEESKQNETIVSNDDETKKNKTKTIEFSAVFTITMYVYFSLFILSFLTYVILKGFGIDLLIKL